MLRKLFHIFAPGLLPFIWAGLFAIFALAYGIMDLPKPAEVVAWSEQVFNSYGNRAVILAAFLEGVFMVSVYFPGSLVLLVAVIVSDGSAGSLFTIAGATWIGFILALIINYIMGERGFYKVLLVLGREETVRSMQVWLNKRERLALFWSASYPTALSVAVVCMGIARRGLARSVFYSAIFMLPWMCLYLLIISTVEKRINLSDNNLGWYFVALLVAWGLALVIKAKPWKQA